MLKFYKDINIATKHHISMQLKESNHNLIRDTRGSLTQHSFIITASIILTDKLPKQEALDEISYQVCQILWLNITCGKWKKLIYPIIIIRYQVSCKRCNKNAIRQEKYSQEAFNFIVLLKQLMQITKQDSPINLTPKVNSGC